MLDWCENRRVDLPEERNLQLSEFEGVLYSRDERVGAQQWPSKMAKRPQQAMATQVRYLRRRKGMHINALGPEANTLQTKQPTEGGDWARRPRAPAPSHSQVRTCFVLAGAHTGGYVHEQTIRVALTAAAFPGEGETSLAMGAATERVWHVPMRTGTIRLRDETLHLQPRPISRPLTGRRDSATAVTAPALVTASTIFRGTEPLRVRSVSQLPLSPSLLRLAPEVAQAAITQTVRASSSLLLSRRRSPSTCHEGSCGFLRLLPILPTPTPSRMSRQQVVPSLNRDAILQRARVHGQVDRVVEMWDRLCCK